jgi:hypothetical protein
VEQPEEGDDNELDGVLLEVAQDWVVDVEDTEELTGYIREGHSSVGAIF